jgi:hypothetical protein
VRASHLLIAVLIVHAVAFAVSAAKSALPASDVDRYYQIASAAGRPYVDYQVEHPIGTLLALKALARLTAARGAFGLGVVILNLAADAVIVGSLIWGWSTIAALYCAAVLVPVLGLFFNRIDAWSTAAAILAVAAWRRDRPIVLGSALAIGAACKLWPIVLVPLLVTPWRGRRSLDGMAAFAAAALVLTGCAAWIAGTKGIMQVLTFRGATGWQIESLIGSLVHLGNTRTLRLESGAWRIGAMNAVASTAMFAAAAPICLWSSWTGARRDRIGAGWLAAVSSLLLLSALFSAQYVIWLAPAGAIAWATGERRLAALTAIAIVLTQVMWMVYGRVLDHELLPMLLIVTRNVVVLALAAFAIVRVRTIR